MSRKRENRTIRTCQVCGKPFYGGADNFYCPECARAKKLDTVVQIRTCWDCGIEFYGGPRARRCPDCRYKARQETSRQHKKHGTIRPLGSVDKCVICGKDYIVKSGRQKYCSKVCQRKGVLTWQREHKRGYDKASGQDIKRQKRHKKAQKVCVYCLRTFTSNTSTNLCSEHCRREQRRLSAYAAELNRGAKVDYARLLDLRERYREAVKTGGDLSGFDGGRSINYSKYQNADMSVLTHGEQSALMAKIKNPEAGAKELAKISGLSVKSIPTLLNRAAHKLDNKKN